MAKHDRDNWESLGDSFYLVRTEAGFRQALKDFVGCTNITNIGIRGYPTTYPSLISFSHGYNGGNFVLANCIHVNAVKKRYC